MKLFFWKFRKFHKKLYTFDLQKSRPCIVNWSLKKAGICKEFWSTFHVSYFNLSHSNDLKLYPGIHKLEKVSALNVCFIPRFLKNLSFLALINWLPESVSIWCSNPWLKEKSLKISLITRFNWTEIVSIVNHEPSY